MADFEKHLPGAHDSYTLLPANSATVATIGSSVRTALELVRELQQAFLEDVYSNLAEIKDLPQSDVFEEMARSTARFSLAVDLLQRSENTLGDLLANRKEFSPHIIEIFERGEGSIRKSVTEPEARDLIQRDSKVVVTDHPDSSEAEPMFELIRLGERIDASEALDA